MLMKRRTTADFGPLDFTPLMARTDSKSYNDPAVSFETEDEALYFLDQVELHYGKCFGNRNGYWRKDKTAIIYIPRLYEDDSRSMTYTQRFENGYPVIPFSDLLIRDYCDFEFTEGELDEILV